MSELSKQPGENAEQAMMRHINTHDAHLNELESKGLHVPRGQATIMKGLPGSGKSYYLKKHHLSHATHIHVDVDALKHLATGEHDFKYPKEYPDSHPTHPDQPHPLAGQRITEKYDEGDPVHVVAAHPVSKRLEQKMFDTCKQRRIPMALDTTGGNHSKWGERIGALRQAGFHHVGLVDIRVSKETSMARNAGRKRVVPQKIIDETYAEHERDHPANFGKTPFEHLKKMVDSVKVVDHESREAGAITKRAAAGWHNYHTSSNGGVGPSGQPQVTKLAKSDNGYDSGYDNPFMGMVRSLYRSR
ncbi:AAA family ATPase [Deinococcus sp. UR1]|uniref:AAA family ATPase n=1 Tax=Deinococcus sp. UR1 TaxID=1704277 RepID=UPI000C1A8082|nr:AAA family ATPase [Deinococcus sp. UR1]PIG96919.1 ATPase [Deinococcus sp. UR1]